MSHILRRVVVQKIISSILIILLIPFYQNSKLINRISYNTLVTLLVILEINFELCLAGNSYNCLVEMRKENFSSSSAYLLTFYSEKKKNLFSHLKKNRVKNNKSHDTLKRHMFSHASSTHQLSSSKCKCVVFGHYN